MSYLIKSFASNYPQHEVRIFSRGYLRQEVLDEGYHAIVHSVWRRNLEYSRSLVFYPCYKRLAPL